MGGKRKLHPARLKDREVLKRLGYRVPRLWDRKVANVEHLLATEQWAEMLRLHIPGLCISDMPRHFELPATLPDGKNGFTWSSLNGLEFDRSQWKKIPGQLSDGISRWGNATTEILEGWTYESVLPPNAEPRLHDEPNPRIYTLEGRMVRSAWKGENLRKGICDLFEIRLVDLFRLSPYNVRKQYVTERLQHHWEHGGNADAFLDYMDGVCDKWEREAPTYFDMPRMQRSQVEDAAILIRTMRKWLEEQRKAKTKRISLKVPTLAERLEAALPGARQAFDEMLLIDGFTNKAGVYVGPKRKGKAGILANWDAVVEAFKVEGYPQHGGALAVALEDYISGLRIDKRISRLRDDQPYRLKLKAAKIYLRGKAKDSQ